MSGKNMDTVKVDTGLAMSIMGVAFITVAVGLLAHSILSASVDYSFVITFKTTLIMFFTSIGGIYVVNGLHKKLSLIKSSE